MDRLAAYGAIPVRERVVEDGNRFTGGWVTAGIDFGLTLMVRVRGEREAKIAQLIAEYNPAPPFRCGSPDTAEPDVLSGAKEALGLS
jgi:cyclohexyl-isocyanide hydratase